MVHDIRKLLLGIIGLNDEIEDKYLLENFFNLKKYEITFKSDEHNKIYRTVQKYIEEDDLIPSIYLLNTVFGEDIEVLEELAKIVPIENNKLTKESPLYSKNYLDIVKRVKNSLDAQMLTSHLKEINNLSCEGKYLAKALIRGQSLLANLYSKIDYSDKVSLSYKSSSIFMELLQDNIKKEERVITSGFNDLNDRVNGGLEESCFWIIAAPVGQLKSTIAVIMSYEQFLKGANVEYISLEMPEIEMWAKLQSLHSANESYWGEDALKLPVNLILNPKKMTEKEIKRYKEVVEDIASKTNYIHFHTPTEDLDVGGISSYLLNVEINNDIILDIAYIDHGELLKPSYDTRNDGYSVRLSDTLRKLRRLSLTFRRRGIRLAVCYQIKRSAIEGVKKSQNGSEGLYTTSDLSWSTEAERSATFILNNYYDGSYYEAGHTLLSWTKNRRGEKNGSFIMKPDLKYSKLLPIDCSFDKNDPNSILEDSASKAKRLKKERKENEKSKAHIKQLAINDSYGIGGN